MNRNDKLAIERYKAKLQTIKSGATINPFESDSEKNARIEAAKADITRFTEYYLPHYATSKSAEFQIRLAKKVAKKQVCSILVRWGRGLAKSVWCDVIIPLWLWSRGDISYMVIVGNNFDKAKILLSDLQAEFEANPRLMHDFGEQKMQGTWEDGYFRTANGFIAKALGMGQSPRGLRLGAKRPDYIVADDLDDRETIKNPRRMREYAQWIEKDLIPAMDGPRRRYLMPNNRFAPVTIQSILEERHPSWPLDLVEAYNPVTYQPAWPEKYPAGYYKEMETEIGTLAAMAEFNNRPHVEGTIFTESQIQWSKLPAITNFEHIVGHWDVAYSDSATADYNAVRVWGLKDDRFYLLDCFLKQSKMRAALEWIADYIRHMPGNVRVRWQFESQFWNDEVQRTIDEVENSNKMDLRLRKVELPKENKYDRIVSTQPYYQNGRIYYSDKLKGHNDTLVGQAQLFGIEPGYKTKDDAPDADERCFSELSTFARRHKRTSQGTRSGNFNKNNLRKG
jgi:predicted phage terminase large subunit-like protein